MIKTATKMPLTDEWKEALEQVERRRQMPHYKPAALWVLLDMLDAGEVPGGRLRFGRFDQRFEDLLASFDPERSRMGWEPFFHLATGNQVWDLYHDERQVAVLKDGKNRSRSFVLHHVSEARLKPELVGFVQTAEGRRTVREAVIEILRGDAFPESQQLVAKLMSRSHTPSSRPAAETRLVPGSSPEDVKRSLRTFNQDSAAYPDLVSSLLKQTTYWIYDSASGSFGPGKFVGYMGMTFEAYDAARAGKTIGARFDGGLTHKKIEQVLGERFSSDAGLSRRLRNWAASLIPSANAGGDIFEGVDEKKWRFLTLPEIRDSRSGQDWTDEEVEATVADYFAMLRAELGNEAFNKAAHRKALLLKLAGRSGPSVEFKYCNISAVLNAKGLPYISGYKPRGNFQESLSDAIAAYLDGHPEFYEQLMAVEPPAPVVPRQPREARIENIETPPPPPKESSVSPPGHGFGPKTDWGLLDARNRKLGKMGEKFVLSLEHRHLSEIGRPDLVDGVEWISEKRGDGEGYDILSFDDAGVPKYIEVKTTNAGWRSAFFISSNEVNVAQQRGEGYWLYRVYNFSSGPKLYRLQGPLVNKLDLEPKVFAARVAATNTP